MSNSDPIPIHNRVSDRKDLVGNVKVTRDDWINLAMDVLVSDGIEKVKIQPLGQKLDVILTRPTDQLCAPRDIRRRYG